jgi:hypothetical protein
MTPGGFASALAGGAADLIPDARHENKRIEQAGELAGDFVREVNFPRFVSDLLKGVFDANLEVTIKQMNAYVELMKAATASISKFVREIDSTAAFGYLAENDDGFNLDFDDNEKDTAGNSVPLLKDKDGNVVARGNEDIGDNAVKVKIMEAKIAMAREQRALLRETILMGITRLVVDKGTVKASVIFDFKTTEKIQKTDKAARKKESSSGGGAKFSGGFVGSILGGVSGGGSTSIKKSEISLSSAKSESNTELAAKLTGSVEIIFKSDYFKLDNFADMYKQIANEPAGTGAPGAAKLLGGNGKK